MPVPVQGPDGNTYQFPDGTDKDAAIAYFRKKGIGGTSTPSPPANEPSWWDKATAPYTEIQPHQMPHNAQELGNEVVKGVGNIGAGGLGVILHPINTIVGAGKFALDANPAAQLYHHFAGTPSSVDELGQQLREHPIETVESGIGQAGAAPVFGAEMKAATAPIRIIPKVVRGGADILAGTTPKIAAELGQKTAEENAAAQAKADAANTVAEQKRSQQLQQHFDKTQQVRAANEAAEATQSRKAALERGVEQLDPKFQEDLKATEQSVRAQANEKYNTVRAAVEGETVPSESLAQAVKTAEAKIQGASENLKIFRDILSKHPEGEPGTIEYQGAQIPKGHPLYDVLKEGSEAGATPATFSDLQGYYSELGEKLSSGNLPGDVYQSLKSLQGSIGDLMQEMAESKGVGPQLTEARAFYRDYMRAFRDSKSPLNKAMKATEAGQSIKQLQGKDQSGVEVLARYNPELARRANTIRGYQSEAKSITAKPKPPVAEPVLPPKPPPSVAEVKKIGLKDIQQAKEADLLASKRVGGLAGGALHGAGVWHFVQSAVHGSPEGMIGGAAIAATPFILTRIFKSPAVMRLLTQPTAADIAAIPPEVRGDLPAIVDAAQKQGIKVHPTLLLMARPNASQQ